MDGIRKITNEKPNAERVNNFGITYGIMRKNMKGMQGN